MATVAGSFGAPLFSSNNWQQPGVVRYAVVGLGNFASYVLPRIMNCQHAKISALVSSDEQKAKQWAATYGIEAANIYSYQTFRQIADNPNIDAVYICTPVGLHEEFALQAMEAGKHVLTEKTMAASSAQGQRMVESAKAAGLQLMTAYRARFDPYNQEAIRLCRSGELGEVTHISAHKGFAIGDKFGKNGWRLDKTLAGGGSLIDIGIYSVQACRYLAGIEPVRVSAIKSRHQMADGIEEGIVFTLEFPGNVLASGSASWSYALQNHYRVMATKGWLELNPATSNGNIGMKVARSESKEEGSVLLPQVDQIPAMFDHFSKCIINKTEPLIAADEGLKDLKVIEAIYRSAETGRAVEV